MTHYLSTAWRWLLAAILMIGIIAGATNTYNWQLALTATIVAAGLVISLPWVASQINRIPRRVFHGIVAVGLIAMIIAQILLLWQMPVTVYHDPFRVLQQALQLANGDYSWRTTYFWRYPNNVAPTFLLSRWFILTNAIHLSANISLALLEMLLLDGFIGLAIVTGWQMSHRQSVTLGIFAFCTLSPFAYTYFLNITYTDLPNMLIILIMIRLIWRWPQIGPRRRIVDGIILVLLAMVGQLIKGNLIVMAPAILLAIVTCQLWQQKKRQLLIPLLAIILGFGLSVPIGMAIDNEIHFHHHPAYEFPATAWIAMGLNQQTNGKYSIPDVSKMIKQPTKTHRSRLANREIRRRIKHAGPDGLVKQFVGKAGILMNTVYISNWYNGGHRQAPAWWLHHATLIELTIGWLSQLAWATLGLMAIKALFFWQSLDRHRQTVACLTVIIALGFLAFHILLWEAEGRYGQILVPLMMILVAIRPPHPVKASRRELLIPLVVGCGAVATCLLTPQRQSFQQVKTSVAGNAMVVAAQRSQLSTQYRARPTMIGPDEVLTQDFRANSPFNQAYVEITIGSHVRTELINLRTGRHYKMTWDADYAGVEQTLPAGQYQLKIENRTRRSQPVPIISTNGYQMAPYPLIRHGKADHHSSLIYAIWQPIQ